MTLEEGIKNGGCPYVIKDCSRATFPRFLVDRGAKVGAEIGVYKAEFTEMLCKAGLFVYAVDPWSAYMEEKRQERQNFLYEHAQRVLTPYENKKIIRKFSMEAVEEFEDESLDFVYIDGNHTFRYVAEDVTEWSKKVKKGGVVSGHDYTSVSRKVRMGCIRHVRAVVDAYVKAMDIKNFCIFSCPSTRRNYDLHSNFLWIKE